MDNFKISFEILRSDLGTVLEALDASDAVKTMVRTLVVKAYEAGLRDAHKLSEEI